MKTSAEDNRSEVEAREVESGPVALSLDSNRPETGFDARIATLQTYLEHAPVLDAENRAEYCADAHRIALAAIESAPDDEKRSLALKLDAELCVWEAEGLPDPARGQQLQRAVAKLEQATLLDSSNIAAHKALARVLSKLADRDDLYLEKYSGFERKSVSAPADWRIWHEWARTLTEHATRVDGARARELLREAAELLRRGSDAVTEPDANARLRDDRGLALRALARRSSMPDGLQHLEESELEFERATEREPTLEAAWSHWAELLLEQARLDSGEARRELQNRALEVLWRGMQAMADPRAACRLSIQRAQALLAMALAGNAEESEARFEEAMHELARAADRDPASVRARSLAAEVCCVRARLAEPERAKQLLREALANNERASRLAAESPDPEASITEPKRAQAPLTGGAVHNDDAARFTAEPREPGSRTAEPERANVLLRDGSVHNEQAAKLAAESPEPVARIAEVEGANVLLGDGVVHDERASRLAAESPDPNARITAPERNAPLQDALAHDERAARLAAESPEPGSRITEPELPKALLRDALARGERAARLTSASPESVSRVNEAERADESDAPVPDSRASSVGEPRAMRDPEHRARLHCQRGAIWCALRELSAGRTRRIAIANAAREFESAVLLSSTDPETALAVARFWCDEARHAELTRARELTSRATDLLLQAAEAAIGEVSAAELRHAYGRALLAATELEPSSARDFTLAKATIAFQDACTARRFYVPAWRSWSRLCRDCATRDSSLESALEQFQEADDVIDAAAQSIPLGEGTAELLTERAGIFLAQARRVRRLERRQCYERAIACLEEATQLAPGLAEPWRCWGLALAERGRFDTTADPAACFTQAYDRYQRAADASPLDRRHEVWLELAAEVCRFARRNPDQATSLVKRVCERLEAVLAEVPNHAAELCLARGDLFAAAGRFTEAEPEYARGRAARMPVAASLFCQHKLSALRQQHGLSARPSRTSHKPRAVRQRDGASGSSRKRFQWLARFRSAPAKRAWLRTQRAYSHYLRTYAPRLDPEVIGAYGCLLHEQVGPVGRADLQLSAAIARRPRAAYRYRLAQVELARERAQIDPREVQTLAVRLEAAREAIESGDLDPAERELELGKLAAYRSEPTIARKHIHAAASLDPWNASSCELLARVALENGDIEHAQELLSAAHDLEPGRVEILPLLASTLTRLGEHDEAELVFQRAVAASPNDARILLAWSDACIARASTSIEVELLARAHDYATQAIELCRQGRSLRLPAHLLAQAHYARGYAAIRLSERSVDLERWEQARRDFHSALRLDPQHHEASRALARIASHGAMRRLTYRRVAASFLGALALGIFAVAQIGFWPRAQPVIQLCAGPQCTDPYLLRALTTTGYATLTFGALAFIALAVALPHWLQPKPASIPLERRPVELEPTRSLLP
jgi:tetratricopeptide (TPR) repeat protein